MGRADEQVNDHSEKLSFLTLGAESVAQTRPQRSALTALRDWGIVTPAGFVPRMRLRGLPRAQARESSHHFVGSTPRRKGIRPTHDGAFLPLKPHTRRCSG
jgi:hypothetical protein